MIGIIGSGAWGTALAQVYATAGHKVLIWARRPEVAHAINEGRVNEANLPGIVLHPNITATLELTHMAEKEIILLATPAQHVRHALGVIKRWLPPGRPVVIVAKGIELKTGLLMSEIAALETPQATIGILSGPTFASDIANGLPSAATIAAKDMNTAQNLRNMLASRTLRPYAGDDLIGAQVGGAVKNVIAIACGMIVGKGLGESARAALMTRGLAEMARLCAALGGKRETLLGLCGVGDLMLTCSSTQSRNYSLGMELGRSKSLQDILGQRSAVTEGVHTAAALVDLAAKHKIDMPVARGVYECLHKNMDLDTAIGAMLDRPLSEEGV